MYIKTKDGHSSYQQKGTLPRYHENRPDTFEGISLVRAYFEKIFEGEMLIRTQSSTLLQIFRESMLFSLVIIKSMKVSDENFPGNSECEWVIIPTNLCRHMQGLETLNTTQQKY